MKEAREAIIKNYFEDEDGDFLDLKDIVTAIDGEEWHYAMWSGGVKEMEDLEEQYPHLYILNVTSRYGDEFIAIGCSKKEVELMNLLVSISDYDSEAMRDFNPIDYKNLEDDEDIWHNGEY